MLHLFESVFGLVAPALGAGKLLDAIRKFVADFDTLVEHEDL